LSDKFIEQAATGRVPSDAEIEKTIRLMLADNFETFRKGA
jgi:hypothetical protein